MLLSHGLPGWGEEHGRSEKLMTQGYCEHRPPPSSASWAPRPARLGISGGQSLQKEMNALQVYDLTC